MPDLNGTCRFAAASAHHEGDRSREMAIKATDNIEQETSVLEKVALLSQTPTMPKVRFALPSIHVFGRQGNPQLCDAVHEAVQLKHLHGIWHKYAGGEANQLLTAYVAGAASGMEPLHLRWLQHWAVQRKKPHACHLAAVPAAAKLLRCVFRPVGRTAGNLGLRCVDLTAMDRRKLCVDSVDSQHAQRCVWSLAGVVAPGVDGGCHTQAVVAKFP